MKDIMSRMSQRMAFYLDLSYEKFFFVYTGKAKYVVAQTDGGRTVRFPANILKPYLTRRGIQGRFMIYFDENNKFKSLEKMS